MTLCPKCQKPVKQPLCRTCGRCTNRRMTLGVVAAALLAGCASAHLREVRPGFIPLETTEPKYQDYFNKIREKIKANWIYPYEAGSRGIEGDLSIEFVIAKDGHLQFIELRRSSQVKILDEYALRAVQLAQPFPPVPDDLAKQALAINGLFVYRLKEGSFR